MAYYLTTDTELMDIANAIRTKGGTEGTLTYPTGFSNAVRNLPQPPTFILLGNAKAENMSMPPDISDLPPGTIVMRGGFSFSLNRKQIYAFEARRYTIGETGELTIVSCHTAGIMYKDSAWQTGAGYNEENARISFSGNRLDVEPAGGMDQTIAIGITLISVAQMN